MKIVLPDHIDLTTEHIEQIKKLGNVTIFTDIPKTEEEIIKRISGAEIITADWIDITANIIEKTPTLKYIIVPAVGYEWIDVKTATAKGIRVLNCPTQNAQAVANLTITLMLAVTRRIIEANNDLKQGEWYPPKYTGIELSGKTLGLIGYGHIGKIVEKFAEALDMKVQHVDSKTTSEELDTLVATSDIVSLHAPLTDATRHILDERRLRLMKKGSYLINTARGGEIDQQTLVNLLETGHLAGAGLDVFENEALTGEKQPEEIIKLAHMPNVVATPHIAFNTQETYFRMGEELIANITSCITGKPINTVN